MKPITERYLTTLDFGGVLGVRPDTVRRGLCTRGHYLGIKPIKLPNRRLLWPVDQVERLLSDSADDRSENRTCKEMAI